MNPAAHLDEETLAGLAIGDLAGQAHLRAMDHLETCPRCRQAVTLLQQGERTPVAGATTEPALELPLDPTVKRDPLIGTRLGEYAVTGVLATGGMGVIYTGVQPVIGRKVAIKVLKPSFEAGSENVFERLLAEARALAAIHHPNIVDVFGFGETPNGQHYFVMDFLEGETLGSLMYRSGRINPHHAMSILDAMLAGLDAAHRAGVLHRDLKPSNVFLVPLPDGTVHVKLLDFGLAKTMGDVRRTAVGVVLGTPGFMAPEQISDEPLSPATDLYALGVIAFAMLTGVNPFPLTGQRELMMAHLEKIPVRVSTLVKGLPDGLDALVAKLLEKRSRNRPESAQEARRELTRIRRISESAPTDRNEPPKPLSGLLKVRGFPEQVPTPLMAVTVGARPTTVRQPPPDEGAWKRWVVGGALVVAGFGAGLWWNRPAAARAEVEARLGEARVKASALKLDAARAAAIKDLDGLEKRLAQGASPLDVSRDLDDAVATHGLK